MPQSTVITFIYDLLTGAHLIDHPECFHTLSKGGVLSMSFAMFNPTIIDHNPVGFMDELN